MASAPASAVVVLQASVMRSRAERLPPQFRSKKNPKLTWSGRGAMVGWMKDEMKGTKLKKEDFRIAR